MHYPQITREKAVEFFVLLRYLADYIIVDCTSTFEADPASIVAIELADRVLKLGTANLKGVSYYLTHNPMLADSRFRKDTHSTVIGNLKTGQDWEAAAQQLGGADFVLPYAPEKSKPKVTSEAAPASQSPKKAKSKIAFRLPFAKGRGEF